MTQLFNTIYAYAGINAFSREELSFRPRRRQDKRAFYRQHVEVILAWFFLSPEVFMSNVTNASYGLSVHTPIDRVIMLIARRLELNDGYDYKLERWIKLLKDNWIQTAGSLSRMM
jgi:hypothetical protein